ncbi:MAG: PIN domain-containing protein [Prevotellaceae bacterium]|nr:PIN domain-containing protein [Prevotellaceae bacterium]
METEAKLFIQQQILLGKYELVWSYILEFENNQNPYSDRRYSIKVWEKIATVFCSENEDILTAAEKLCTAGIKIKDALHIACAAYTQADYFITTDKRLLNAKVTEIKIVNPLTFIDTLDS